VLSVFSYCIPVVLAPVVDPACRSAGASRDGTVPAHRVAFTPCARLPGTRHARVGGSDRPLALGVRPFFRFLLTSSTPWARGARTDVSFVADSAFGSLSSPSSVSRRSSGGRERREPGPRCSTWGASVFPPHDDCAATNLGLLSHNRWWAFTASFLSHAPAHLASCRLTNAIRLQFPLGSLTLLTFSLATVFDSIFFKSAVFERA
jgi:hypothetical protein